MRVLIACGGTGGHIYPGLAVAEELRRANTEVLFLGVRSNMEAEIVPREGFDIHFVRAGKLLRRPTWRWVPNFWNAMVGCLQAVRLVRRFQPDVILGMGGYVSFPGVWAGHWLRVPLLIHEQNAWPGLTNRIVSRWCQRICVSHQAARSGFPDFPEDRLVLTGNPVRQGLARWRRGEAAEALGVNPDADTLLLFGGSRGARSLNTALRDALPLLDKELRRPWQIIWQCGREEVEKHRDVAVRFAGRVHLYPYIDQMGAAYAVADLVVCRAGASTLAEITLLGKAAILVPYPYATGGHQEANARALADAGAALTISDTKLTGEELAKTVIEAIKDKIYLQSLQEKSKAYGKPEATCTVAYEVSALANRTRGRD